MKSLKGLSFKEPLNSFACLESNTALQFIFLPLPEQKLCKVGLVLIDIKP